MKLLGYLAVLLVGMVAVALAWRFIMFRNAGAQGLVRVMPAEGVHGWRHGIVHYAGDEALFYKLRSLSFYCDFSIDRRNASFDGMRELTAEEQDFMPGVESVLELTAGDAKFEFAAERHVEMALISWIESAPDMRTQRGDMNVLAERAGRGGREGSTGRRPR